MYSEYHSDGTLKYFDVLGKLFVEPELWGCIYTMWGYAAEDCTASEITVRSSFAKVPSRPTYEPFHYSDQMLSRFGFFRTEYFTYDPQRGLTDMGRQFLIERHNLYTTAYREDGSLIPVQDRETRTIPYYLSNPFPEDEVLRKAADDTLEQWNQVAKKSISVSKDNEPVETDIFVLCRNPVTEDDHDACGAPGFSPRVGDLRYSTLHWVDPYTQQGLLGYGPSAVDPLTGKLFPAKCLCLRRSRE